MHKPLINSRDRTNICNICNTPCCLIFLCLILSYMALIFELFGLFEDENISNFTN